MKALIFLGLALALPAFSQTVATNPVVELYTQRSELTKLELKKAQALELWLDETLRNYEELPGIVPNRTVREARRDHDAAKIQLEILKTKVKEAEALVEIAKYRVVHGAEMPLCQEQR